MPLVLQHPVRAVAYSSDSRSVIIGTEDGLVYLYDSKTWRPIGKPIRHPQAIAAVAISDDGHRFLSHTDDGTARLWQIPRVPVEPSQFGTWSELHTGLMIDAQGSVTALDHQAWLERRETLKRNVVSTSLSQQAPGDDLTWVAIRNAAIRRLGGLSRWLGDLWENPLVGIAGFVALVYVLRSRLAKIASSLNMEPRPLRSRKRTRRLRTVFELCFVAAALGTAYVEWMAYQNASLTLKALDARAGSRTGSTSRSEVEKLLGRSADGPGREAYGTLVVAYSWQAVFYTHVLHVEYSLQPKSNPIMLTYSAEKIPRFAQILNVGSGDH
jgi:hypothetical protein